MGSGSIRIHASDLQERMFNLLGFSHEEAWKRFGFLLEAFKYVRRRTGFAFGIDRLMMVLQGLKAFGMSSLFPRHRTLPAMMNTPDSVAPEQLQALKCALC